MEPHTYTEGGGEERKVEEFIALSRFRKHDHLLKETKRITSLRLLEI